MIEVKQSQPMRRKRRPNSTTPESKVLAAVRAWAEGKPEVYIVRVVTAGRSGTPDFVMSIKGRFVAAECKSDTGKPTALQRIHLAEIEASGGLAVWGNADTVIAFLDKIYKGE